MSSELEEIYQQVILDHSKRPRNRGELPGAVRAEGSNPSCGDEIQLDVLFGGDGAIQDMKFMGHGCAISQASASLMTTKLKGKSRAEAEKLLKAFSALVIAPRDAEPSSSSPVEAELGDLSLLRSVRKFPQRVKCAMLAWRALELALRE